MDNKRTPNLLSYLPLLLCVVLVAAWISGAFNTDSLAYSEVVTLFREEKVRSFSIQDGTITMSLRENKSNGTPMIVSGKVDTDFFLGELGGLIEQQRENKVLENYSILPASEPSVLTKSMPYLLAGSFLLFLWAFFNNRSAQSNPMSSFTRARAGVGSKDKVTFDDVAGSIEEKAELQEVVEFLKDPEKFQRMGARIPRGILLVGPPGTGKTMLARAVAGEAGVSFLSISGSDFVEMYVGVGASRVRDLFNQAKKMAPAIIFIDEIDAVGRKRGAGMGGGHDEKEQTLNQLLVEMDGFEKNSDIIVLAATNRQDILDPALLRPGRFDRQIYVAAPDAASREAILKVHARDKSLDADVSLKTVAMGTGGFTGADLSNLLNEAAILAVRADRPAINMDDMNEALLKVMAGPAKKSHKALQRDLRITAIHEAGHAVAIYRLPTQDPVHQITIIPRGRAAGLTIHLPTEESGHLTRNEMFESIVAGLGGRVAEELFCDDISAGASSDLKRATETAQDMVGRYGMSDALGAVAFQGSDEIFVGRDYERTKSYSEQTAGIMDHEIRTIVDRAHAQCRDLLQADGDKVLRVAEFLLAHETMSGKQFKACMEGREIDLTEKADIFAEVSEEAE